MGEHIYNIRNEPTFFFTTELGMSFFRMNNMCVVLEHHVIKVKERCRVGGRFLMEARGKKITRSSESSTHY